MLTEPANRSTAESPAHAQGLPVTREPRGTILSPSRRGDARVRNLHFRPIEPRDKHRLQMFHQRLSPLTVQLRFHGAKRELSEPLARRFTDLDGHDDVAWLVTTGTRGRIVGVARYFRLSNTCAEVAFVVEDTFQGCGVGRRLMHHLRQSAIDNGITEFVADVLPGNSAMLRLLEAAGSTETRNRNGVCEVRVSLKDQN